MLQKQLPQLFFLLVVIFFNVGHSHAEEIQEISFNQTRSNFIAPDQSIQTWHLQTDGLELFAVNVQRIGGQYGIGVQVARQNGDILEPTQRLTTFQGETLEFLDYFTEPETLNIVITGDMINGSGEYSLTVTKLGQNLDSVTEGLNIPTLTPDTYTSVTFENGTPPEIEDDRKQLRLPIYGDATVTKSQVVVGTQNYTITGGGITIDNLNNGSGLGRVIQSISAVDEGLGLTAKAPADISLPPAQILMRTSMETIVNDATSITLVTRSGRVLSTDFFQIESITIDEDAAYVQLRSGRQLILGGGQVDLRQKSGLLGITFETSQTLTTNFAGWDTLVYLPEITPEALNIISGNSFRFRSDFLNMSVNQDDSLPTSLNIQINLENTTLPLHIEPVLISDVILHEAELSIRSLDGREVVEPIANVSALTIEADAILIARADGTELLSTHSVPVATPEASVVATNERSSGFNTLGNTILPTCLPCQQLLQDALPVNPANGNFHYAVEDVSIISHTLPLEFTRFYNAQGSQSVAGWGWRHSYAIELDLRRLVQGRVEMRMADGASHIFRVANGSPANLTFNSATLPFWQLTRDSFLGAWTALRTDGLIYRFNNAGQLQYIENRPGQMLELSPAPVEYLTDEFASGIFVVEPYGRRLEIYQNSDGYIVQVNNPLYDTPIRYNYSENGLLREVIYGNESQKAVYTYDENNRLASIDDVRSPFTRDITIAYDNAGRVSGYVLNPEGDLRRTVEYSYQNAPRPQDNAPANTTYTVRTITVGDTQQVHRWLLDENMRIIRWELPRDGWYYEYAYSPEKPMQLQSVRQPEGFRLSYEYNAQGHITRITDPVNGTAGATSFSYVPLGESAHELLLEEINYQNIATDRFTYNDMGLLETRSHTVGKDESNNIVEQTSEYVYDNWGRITTVRQNGNSETTYSYDNFGYVSSISENNLRNYSLTHTSTGQLLTYTDGNGNIYTLSWDIPRGLITRLEAPLDYRVSYSYDAQGRMVGESKQGAITKFVLDGMNNIVSTTNPIGEVTRYVYDETGNVTQIILPDETVYQYGYDTLDNLVQVISPMNRITKYQIQLARSPQGSLNGQRIEEKTDPLGRVTRYIFDPLGRITQADMRDASNRPIYTFNFRYSNSGRTVEVEQLGSSAGRNITVQYNELGLPVSIDMNKAITNYTYDTGGNLVRVVDPSQREVNYSYDELGRMVSVSLPVAEGLPVAEYRYTYDLNDNLLETMAPLGTSTVYHYDALNRLTDITDALGNRTSYNYDSHGNLFGVTDPNGNVQTATYNDIDQLLSVSDNLGNQTAYNYDHLNRLTAIIAPRGFQQTYTYDADSNMIALSQPQSRNFLYSYDLLRRIDSVTNPLGQSQFFSYDRLGGIQRIVDAVGNAETFVWNGNGRLRYFYNQEGLSYEYAFDPLGRLTQIADRNNQNVVPNTRFEYDPSGYLLRLRYGTGQVIGSNADLSHVYSYTPQGALQSYTDPEGNLWMAQYDLNGNLVEYSAPDGTRTAFAYDDVGNIIQITYAMGTDDALSESFEYDPNGNLITHIKRDGIVDQFEYDANNQLIRYVEAAGTANTREYLYAYDELGYPISVTDPMGHVTNYRYDVFGNIIAKVEHLSEVESGEATDVITRFEYDGANNLTAIALPQGTQQETTVAGDDYTVNFTYDATNNRVRFVDAEDHVWAYVYNNRGILQQISDPLGSLTSYQYDEMGHIESIVYPTGSVVRFAYDNIGGLRTIENADTEIRQFGNQETVTTGNAVTTYHIDRLGRVVSITDGSGTTTYTYNAIGQLVKRIDARSIETDYEYDRLGNLISLNAPTNNISRQYDQEGRLLQLVRGGETYNYTYNEIGELVTFTSNNLSINYEYDTNGNIVKRDTGTLGTTEYRYDSLNRLVEVSLAGKSIQFEYNLNNWITRITRSNGVSTTFQYDTNGNRTRITHLNSNNQLLDLFTYSYDAAGNITRVDRLDEWAVLYSYDRNHQLISERWVDPSNVVHYQLSIRYDDAGNRVETVETQAGATVPRRTVYVYNNENQLIEEIQNYRQPEVSFQYIFPIGLLILLGCGLRKIAVRRIILSQIFALPFLLPFLQAGPELPEFHIQYTYDRQGNLTHIVYPEETGGVLNLEYDSENFLTGMNGTDQAGENFTLNLAYNALHQLDTWQFGEASYRLLWDNDELLGIINQTTSEREFYLEPFPGMRLLTTSGGIDERWNLLDVSNSVRKIALADGNTSGEPGSSINFNAFGEYIQPYGEDLTLQAPDFPSRQYGGMVYDPGSGYYLTNLRAYNPNYGRFIQRDPIRQDPRGTLYTYSHNRPTVMRDPSGATPIWAYAATAAPNFIDDFKLVPNPRVLLGQVSQPSTVYILQAEESDRGLQAMQRLKYGFNEQVSVLDPNLEAFYAYRTNPALDAITAMQYQQLEQQLLPFQSGVGNRILLEPTPAMNPTPFATYEAIHSHLQTTIAHPFTWWDTKDFTTFNLPEWTVQTPASNPATQQFEYFETLLPDSLMTSVYPQIEMLTTNPMGLESFTPNRLPAISVPGIVKNPVILDNIEALHTQQRQFYEDALMITNLTGLPEE